MTAVELLARLRRHGVVLRAEQGRLRYTAPPGALTEQLRAEIATRRADLMGLLAADAAWYAQPDADRRHEPFALTDLQQAYLVGEQDFYAHRAPALLYHEYHLDDVDPDRLEGALRRLSDTFGALRLQVFPDGSQRLRPAPAPGPLLARTEARQMTGARAGVAAALPPLTAGQPYLLRLVRLPGGWRLQVALRLIAFDGVTTQLFFRELARAYADCGYRPAPEDFSFPDYVRALYASRSAPGYHDSLAYWLQRLEQLPGGPALPAAAGVHPGAASPPGAALRRLTTRLDPDRWRQLRAHAAAAGVPAGSALFALFTEALHRWSDAASAAVTVLVAHRPLGHPGVATVWGNCSTTVPVAVAPTDGPFRDRARAVQARLYADVRHAAVSGVELTRRRQRHGQPATPGPLVVFTSGLDPAGPDTGFLLRLPGARLVHSFVSTPQVLLDHQVYEEDGELVCNIDYAPGHYPAGLVEELADYHRARLFRLAERAEAWDDGQPAELPAAQLAERHRANATARDFPPGSLHGLTLAGAAGHPHRPALVDAARALDHAALDAESAALAGQLVAAGLRTGQLAAIALPKGWRQVVAALAVLRAGGAYLPLDVRWPPARIAAVLRHSGAALLIDQTGLTPLDAGADPGVPTDGGADPGAGADLDAPSGADPTGYVIYTSGSTGTPKGVQMTHAAAVNTLRDLVERFDIGPADRVLAVSALSFDLSVFDIFGILGAGGTVVLPPDSATPDPQAWAASIREHGVTVWNSVPALMDLLLEYLGARAAGDLATLRLVMLSGDWFPLPLLHRLRAVLPHAQVVSLGGATEAAIWSNAFDTRAQPADWPSVPYGYPLANQSLHVLDPQLADSPTWVPGDLYLGGAGLARGYLHDPQRTAAAFIRHPRTGQRLYRTGDRARYRPGGIVEFLGRLDTQVKVDGFRIELGEIEAALLTFPGVDAAVATVDAQRRLVAFVTAGSAVDVAALRAHLADRLPHYMVPALLSQVDTFPLSANGKVDRSALAARAARTARTARVVHSGQPAPAGAHPPRGATEQRLAAIWSELLDTPVRRADADFFALGGNSLLAVRLFHRVEEAFGRRLPLSSLFRHRTLAAQALLLTGDAAEQPEPILVGVRTGTGPRLVLPHPVGGTVLCYQELADALRAELGGELDIRALRAAGLHPGEQPAASLDAMVDHYVRELTGAYPADPVHLAGWSMGGVLALRIAEELAARGRPAASLVLLDSFAGDAHPGPPGPGTAGGSGIAGGPGIAGGSGIAGGPGTAGAPRARLAAFVTDLCGGALTGPELPADLAAAQRLLRERNLLPAGFDTAALARLFAVYDNNSRLLENFALRQRPTAVAWPPSCVVVRAGTPRDRFPALRPVDELIAGTPARRIHLAGEDHYSVVRGAGARRVAAVIAQAVRGPAAPLVAGGWPAADGRERDDVSRG